MAAAAAGPADSSTRYIYKIVPGHPSIPVGSDGKLSPSFTLPSSSLDIQSGFLHMSRAAQIPGTLRHFFATSNDARNSVYLLRVDYGMLERIGDANGGIKVRWESPDASICGPREGEGMFPHIYLNEKAFALDGLEGDERLAKLGGTAAANTGSSDRDGNEGPADEVVVEVESAVELVSEEGDEGWGNALSKLKDWLI